MTINWMATLGDTRRLSELTIPGSHNSCALREPYPGTARCQSLSLPEQLLAGVRFFDIRCRHLENRLDIYHGPIFQGVSFQDVQTAFAAFLLQHSEETLIVSVKEEFTPYKNTRSFAETLAAYLTNGTVGWCLGTQIPKLAEVRGKIVLLRRFASSTRLGIAADEWQENQTFAIFNSYASLRVQDEYIVNDVNQKWNSIQQLLWKAASEEQDTLFLNFTSGFAPGPVGIPNIRVVVNAINPSLSLFLANCPQLRLGIIVMDFVNQAICQSVIAMNA